MKTRDDNFEFLKEKLPKKFDLIYLDSIHEADHVQKIFYHYYEFLKIGGQFYIDDISWLPYLKSNYRDNFYCEINNKETFERLMKIYNNNFDNFDIYFTYIIRHVQDSQKTKSNKPTKKDYFKGKKF